MAQIIFRQLPLICSPLVLSLIICHPDRHCPSMVRDPPCHWRALGMEFLPLKGPIPQPIPIPNPLNSLSVLLWCSASMDRCSARIALPSKSIFFPSCHSFLSCSSTGRDMFPLPRMCLSHIFTRLASSFFWISAPVRCLLYHPFYMVPAS